MEKGGKMSMNSELLCRISPGDITVNRQVALRFTMKSQGSREVKFYNEGDYTAQKIPNINEATPLSDVTYFYFFFTYGDATDALMKGDVENIQFTWRDKNWDVAECTDPNIGIYWKICPLKDIIWEAHADPEKSELVIDFPDVVCNGAVGTAYAYLQIGSNKDRIEMSVEKYPEPKIENFKVLSSGPHYIGEKGTLGWTIKNHANYTISLDGSPVIQDTDDYKTEVEIKYGEYTLTAQNRAGTVDQQKTEFDLKIINNFEINEMSPTKAVLSWEIEERNADEWKLKGFSFQELKAKEDKKEIQTETTSDRTFELIVTPKNSGDKVYKDASFVAPVIESFKVKHEKVNKSERLDCEDMLTEVDENGFISPNLIRGEHRDGYCTSFSFSCKGGGGGGGNSYNHHFTWTVKNVESCYITVNGNRQGSYDASVTNCTVTNQYEKCTGTLEAEGQYKYTVYKDSEEEK